MKTEFLKSLGLEQDVIDKIMAEAGKDLNAEKAKTQKAESERDNLQDQLNTTKGALGAFDGVDVEGMKAQIANLQNDLKKKDDEYAAKEADRAFRQTINEAIGAQHGKNAKAIMAMLNMDALKASKNQSEDIKNALEAVKESDGYLFGSDEPINNPVVGVSTAGSSDSFATIRKLMGLPEKSN